MADRHDRLRHDRVFQHAFVRWEKSQQVPNAPGPSGQSESSTSSGHASPHAIPFYFSHRRRDSPSDASLPISSRWRQVTPVPPIVDPLTPYTVDPLPPPTVAHAIQCHLHMVKLLRMLSQRLLDVVYIICPYCLCIQTILANIYGTKR